MDFFAVPPVPLAVGLIDEAINENVKVVTADVILAKPLFLTFTLNEYVPTGFCPFIQIY